MSFLVFEAAPEQTSAPNRADIACFVGYVDLRPGARIPDPVMAWLKQRNWPADKLINVPVPIESWPAFDQLFDWDRRALAKAGETGTTYLGAAVRTFFAEGGRKCYVVRVGTPWPLKGVTGADPSIAVNGPSPLDFQRDRLARIEALIPGFPATTTMNPHDDASSWRGIGCLFGLPDVSFLALPDLPDAVAIPAAPPARAFTEPPHRDEPFVECASERAETGGGDVRNYRAPRCDAQAYRVWVRALECTREILERWRREVQLVAAVPLPEPGSYVEAKLPQLLRDCDASIALGDTAARGGIASAFIQLIYPWLRTAGSADLPEALESPDGALTGVLARNALLRGSYRSAARLPTCHVHDVYPLLSTQQLDSVSTQQHARSMRERVSIFGRTPSGLQLLSDVSMSADESYRPANVNRLVSAVVRAARRLGEELIFESSDEQLWARMRAQLEGLLLMLYRAGALRGANPSEAFQVRCDRTTMTQTDVDAGRVIAHVQFEVAAPIEQITIVLALEATRGLTVSASAARTAA
jgi:hypothetical protein